MGKAKKEHRKKVVKRNQVIKDQQNRMQRMYNGLMSQIKQEEKDGAYRNTVEAPTIDPIYMPQINLDSNEQKSE